MKNAYPNLVEPLLNTAITTPYLHMEDVSLTGICAQAIGIRPKDNRGFSYKTQKNLVHVFLSKS